MVAGVTKSTVVDTDIAGFIEEERLKKGYTKSKAINNLLRELYDQKKGSKMDVKLGDEIRSKDVLSSTIQEIQNNIRNVTETKKETEPRENVITSEIKKEEKIPELTSPGNPPSIPDKYSIVDTKSNDLVSLKTVSQLNSIVNNITKSENEKKEEKDNSTNQKSEQIKLNKEENKQIINKQFTNNKKGYRMSGQLEEQVVIPRKSQKEVYQELREQEKFHEAFNNMYKKIQDIDDRVCKDGECTKNELAGLRKELEHSKSETSNLVNELKNLRTDFGKLNEIDNVKKDLGDIKGKIKKTDLCPSCGYDQVPQLASYCPNCSTEFHEWSDDAGNKIANWKPFKERVKK